MGLNNIVKQKLNKDNGSERPIYGHSEMKENEM